MGYISEIFDRLDIQQIREFLLHGVECVEVSEKTFDERIKEAQNLATEKIKMKLPDMNEYEEITNDVHHYASVMQDVYMEVGIQCGTVLTMQLMRKSKKE